MGAQVIKQLSEDYFDKENEKHKQLNKNQLKQQSNVKQIKGDQKIKNKIINIKNTLINLQKVQQISNQQVVQQDIKPILYKQVFTYILQISYSKSYKFIIQNKNIKSSHKREFQISYLLYPFLQSIISTNLTYIHISYQKQSPVQILSNIKFNNLTYLNLSNNSITSVQPIQLIYAPSLTTIDLSQYKSVQFSYKPFVKTYFPSLQNIYTSSVSQAQDMQYTYHKKYAIYKIIGKRILKQLKSNSKFQTQSSRNYDCRSLTWTIKFIGNKS